MEPHPQEPLAEDAADLAFLAPRVISSVERELQR